MLDNTPSWPRSIYPKFNDKKFDYSRDANLNAYLKTADRLWINISVIGSDKIDIKIAEEAIDKILSSETLHEMTVYSEILWDAYNSYDTTLLLIKNKISTSDRNGKEKLILLLQYLRMDSSMNRRHIIGKHYLEIEKDVSFFRQISIDAKQLIAETQA